MGFLDDLKGFAFGKDPKTDVSTLPTFTPDQQAASGELIKFLQGGGSPNANQGFTGDLVAPLSNLETLSLSALEDRSRAIATTGDPNIRAASEALQQILGSGPTDVENFIETNVNQPLQDQFTKARDTTGARFADQFFGSERRKSDENNLDNFLSTLARTQASTRLGAREQDIQAKLRAIGLAPELAGAEQGQLVELLNAGGIPRDIEDRQLQGEFLRFQDARDRELDLSEIINQFLGVRGQENVVTQTSGSTGLIPGFLEAAAGTAGKGLGRKIF